MTIEEALDYIKPIVPLLYVADAAKINSNTLSQAKNHLAVNGKPRVFTPEQIEKLKSAITEIGEDLMQTKVETYGSVAGALNHLGCTRINMREFTANYLNRSPNWMKQRLRHLPYTDCNGHVRDYYDRFKPEDIKLINQSLYSIGYMLTSLDIEGSNFQSDDNDQLLQDEIELGLI